jgi:hypothetical protein
MSSSWTSSHPSYFGYCFIITIVTTAVAALSPGFPPFAVRRGLTHYSHSQNSLMQLILTKTQILDDLIVVEQQHQLVCHHHHIIISKLHL